MKKTHKIFIFIIIIFLLITPLLGLFQQTGNYKTKASIFQLYSKSDDFILIKNNSDFDKYDSGGDGSLATPWIIKNYIINGNGSTCINVTDTDAYFILENCTVYNGSTGILLANVSNAKIINTTIHYNIDGIFLNKSHNNTLFLNNISYNTQNGINLLKSHYANITKNLIFGNPFNHSIYNRSSNETILQDNDLKPLGPIVNALPDTIIGNRVTLSWNPLPGATYYLIYRSSTPIISNEGLNYIAISYLPNYSGYFYVRGVYYFAVAAVNIVSGETSFVSNFNALTLIPSTLDPLSVLTTFLTIICIIGIIAISFFLLIIYKARKLEKLE
ncbi:MAG: hypothetical protein EAX96_03010 [Candidatus Lokiarchaeota archaeon]|nr:hypothetical protein [Candidatus Lokiarchaeota archaeon]